MKSTHIKPLNRQEFFKRLAILAGNTIAAMSLLPLLENNSTLDFRILFF
jgi:hypothetical protein